MQVLMHNLLYTLSVCQGLTVPEVVLGLRRTAVLVVAGGWAIPKVVAGRLVAGMTTFSVGIACQVRERTGVRGSLLSMARFSLRRERKIVKYWLNFDFLSWYHLFNIYVLKDDYVIKRAHLLSSASNNVANASSSRSRGRWALYARPNSRTFAIRASWSSRNLASRFFMVFVACWRSISNDWIRPAFCTSKLEH